MAIEFFQKSKKAGRFLGWRRTLVYLLPFLFLVLSGFPVKADFSFDPLELKIKWEEDGRRNRWGGGGNFIFGDTTINWAFSLSNPADDEDRSWFKAGWKKYLGDNWQMGLEMKFAGQPVCNYHSYQIYTGNRSRKPWRFRVWAEQEERFVKPTATVEPYSFTEIGLRTGWVVSDNLSWKGELYNRNKTYQDSLDSWKKLYFISEVTGCWGQNKFTVCFKESTGEYLNAWDNYYSRSWILAWSGVKKKWGWKTRTRLTREEWGDGNIRQERGVSGQLSYSCSAQSIFTFLAGYEEALGNEVLSPDEEEEQFFSPGGRFGLRWNHQFGSGKLRLEFFWPEEENNKGYGGLAVWQWKTGDWQWKVGIAPWGGFNLSEEKGYWIETEYYL